MSQPGDDSTPGLDATAAVRVRRRSFNLVEIVVLDTTSPLPDIYSSRKTLSSLPLVSIETPGPSRHHQTRQSERTRILITPGRLGHLSDR